MGTAHQFHSSTRCKQLLLYVNNYMLSETTAWTQEWEKHGVRFKKLVKQWFALMLIETSLTNEGNLPQFTVILNSARITLGFCDLKVKLTKFYLKFDNVVIILQEKKINLFCYCHFIKSFSNVSFL